MMCVHTPKRRPRCPASGRGFSGSLTMIEVEHSAETGPADDLATSQLRAQTFQTAACATQLRAWTFPSFSSATAAGPRSFGFSALGAPG
jgi:hypothetical protein